MSTEDQATPEERAAIKRAAKISGQDRIAINLTARWLGQIVVIISGFVIPRLIDRNLGATALGVWDFAWSTVSYFRFMGFGLSGGLNRFVALYNAREDHAALQRAVSSTFFLQIIVAALTTLAAFLVASSLHLLFKDLSAEEIEASRWVIFFLGANLAVRMLFWPSRSILTGYHYWTITAAVTAVGDTVLLVMMYFTLKTGGGLADLALIVFLNAVVVEIVRTFMAKRIYPFPLLVWTAVKLKTMRKMFVFGVTNSLTGLPNIVALQSTAIVLASAAGPAALAVYARPLALFNHVERLIKLYAFLLTPMAASLQGLKRDQDLKTVLLTSLMSSFAMTIPPLIVLSAYGDVIVELWMGPEYVIPALAPILGAAVLFPYAHSAAMRIMVGVNAHGRLALWSFLATGVTLAVSMFVANNVGWRPEVAAIVVGVSLFAGPGLVVMVGACRRFQVSFTEYLSAALLKPLLCNLVLLAVVVFSRYYDEHVSIVDAALWSLLGGSLVLGLYWKFLVTEEIREKLLRKFGLRKKSRKSVNSEGA